VTRDSFSSSSDSRIAVIPMSECKVCLEELSIEPLSCCSSSICLKCLYSHFSSHIIEGRIRIICPSCPHIFTREQILLLLSSNDENEDISTRYKRFYADINRESHIKTCPRCCSIKEIDKHIFQGVRWKRNIPRKVICNQCQFEWCFFCHAPWHNKINCKEYQQGEKMLRSWAARIDQNQQNAQQCPRCKVSIETLFSPSLSPLFLSFRFIYLEMVVVLIWFAQNVNVIFVIIVENEDLE
jgi:E3 ubiquitin-protein ligase RNF217